MDEKKAQKRVKKAVKSNSRWIVFWIVAFAVASIIITVSIFSQKREDDNEGATITVIKAVTCKSDDYFYPLFSHDEATKKELRIIVTFNGDDVRSLSLQQMLYYDDKDLAVKSEAENHAAINGHFGEDGMEADALGASFAVMGEGVRYGIYATYDELGMKGKKYFLLDKAKDYDFNSIKDAYTGLGLECSDS